MSRSTDQYLIRQRGEIVLWDWAGWKQKRIDLASGVVRSWPIPSDMRVEMRERLGTAFGMLPFEGPASIPASARWGSIDSTAENGPGQDLYELRWTEREGRDREIQRKWRVTMDSKTRLPERAEYYIKLSTDPDYTLETDGDIRISYPRSNADRHGRLVELLHDAGGDYALINWVW